MWMGPGARRFGLSATNLSEMVARIGDLEMALEVARWLIVGASIALARAAGRRLDNINMVHRVLF